MLDLIALALLGWFFGWGGIAFGVIFWLLWTLLEAIERQESQNRRR